MQVDDDAIFRQAFDRQVAHVSYTMICALAAALRWLRRGLIQDTGCKKKDCPQNLRKGGADDSEEGINSTYIFQKIFYKQTYDCI